MCNKLAPRITFIGHAELDLYTFKLKDVDDGVFVKLNLAIVIDVSLGMGSHQAAISMDVYGILIFLHTGYHPLITK